MVEFQPTPRQQRALRRYAQLERNWVRRGFTPNEAYYLISHGFDMQRARTGSGMHAFIYATIERRRRVIQRLKDLGFTERDIFNYLTEQDENRNMGVEDLKEQFSPLGSDEPSGFQSRAERLEYIRADAAQPAAELLEIGSSEDWATSDLRQYDYNNMWAPYRIDRLSESRQVIERGTRFPDFEREE